MEKWKIINSKYIERSDWVNWRIDTCELPNGSRLDDYHVSEYPPGVGTVAVTAEKEIILVRQYRHGVRDTLTEIPGGSIMPEDSSPLQAAQRELREETGYSSDQWIELASLSAHPASHQFPVFIFLALDASRTSDQKLDRTEQIEVVRVPIESASDMIRKQLLQSLGSAAGLLLAKEYMALMNNGQ